ADCGLCLQLAIDPSCTNHNFTFLTIVDRIGDRNNAIYGHQNVAKNGSDWFKTLDFNSTNDHQRPPVLFYLFQGNQTLSETVESVEKFNISQYTGGYFIETNK